jgi:phospholipase/carboxylesterase
MTASTTLDGPRSAPASGGPARQLVILLHGLGADGNDLIAMAPLIGQILPDAAFAAPDAPEPCDMAPMGRQWFSLRDLSPDAVLRGVRDAAPRLDAFIDEERSRLGLDDDRVALVGFSQGTMMALHCGLRRAKSLAGIAGFSGLLAGAEALAAEIASRPPVLLVHGEADEVVPFGAMAVARSALEAAGVRVHAHPRPGLGHSIDQRGLGMGIGFLKSVFDPAAPGGDRPSP